MVICMGAAVSLYSGYEGCRQLLYKMQLRMTTEAFAAELRELQRNTMFKSSGRCETLRITPTADGYAIFDGLKVKRSVNFSKKGGGSVYFSQQIPVLSFSATGSPAASGAYVLRHKMLKNFSCRLSVQPVTGRVISVEEK